MKIDLTTREVPPDREQPGVFADVIETVKIDKKNRHFKMLVLVGELAATKSNGKRFYKGRPTCVPLLSEWRSLRSWKANENRRIVNTFRSTSRPLP